MDIGELFAGLLDYSDDDRYPKVTDFRNVRKVPSKEHGPRGYSFIFEACVDGKWIEYGPIVNGNWTVQAGQKDHLPLRNCWGKYTPDTIPIGYYRLDELFGDLPLTE